MPSTYSTSLRLELQATGENNNTWGTNANGVFSRIDEAIAGVASVSMTDANYTLTANNGTSDEARQAIIHLTGTLSATRNVVVPTADKSWLVYNNTTGGQSVVVKTSAGTGVTIANGKKRMVYCDGTNVVDHLNDLPSGTTIGGATAYVAGGTDVAVADGGTGASSAADARTNLGLVIGTNVQAYSANLATWSGVAPSANGQSLVAAADYSAMRTLLSLGSMALQASSSVSISGGSISGITDLAVADGGTGSSTASGARTNLGVAIGSDVQAYSSKLANLAASSGVSGTITVSSSSPSGGSDGDVWLVYT